MAMASSSSPLIVVVMIMILGVASANARALFVFGDSLVDNGNNNYLATTARADAYPYGIDFAPSNYRPTGRFSNGYNIPDYISKQIGSEPTLPYLSPQLSGQKLLNGANFASAGIGILNDTGVQFINVIRMYRQLEYFEQYQRRLSGLVGARKAKQVVNQALVLITVGGNDFVNNYFLVPFSPRSRQYSLPDYVKLLIVEYRKLLLQVHRLGARRVLVTGTGPLGCVPAELAMRGGGNGKCSPELQRAAGLYNPQLIQMIQSLNRQLGSHIFIAANTAQMHYDFITNPRAYGFATSKVACCGQGPYNGLGLCTIASNLCSNRDTYAFWDAFHPSERANKIIVDQMTKGSDELMHPMNLSSIMAIDSGF